MNTQYWIVFGNVIVGSATSLDSARRRGIGEAARRSATEFRIWRSSSPRTGSRLERWRMIAAWILHPITGWRQEIK